MILHPIFQLANKNPNFPSCHAYKLQTAALPAATRAIQPNLCAFNALAAEVSSSSVPPAAVVPLGKVPFKMMVEVPLTSATRIKLLLRLAYDPLPITSSKKLLLSWSSQPHSLYC